jgi:hemoglobin
MEESKTTKNIPSLAEWAGGKEKFERLTELFYKKVMADELLRSIFQHMSPEHAVRVAHFITEVFGGELLYTGEQKRNHATMVAQHVGKNLTEQHRRRWINLLLDTADEVGMADDPEFRSAFVGYLEWGSRIAIMNSNASSNMVKEDEPMPNWGWGETGGPYQG